MKVNVTKPKLNNIIKDYLTNNIYPDYDWGPELHDFYREDVEKYGSVNFYIDDSEAYNYHGYSDLLSGEIQEVGILYIEKWLSNKLSSLFGNFWVPVFKDWFEENSGLKVKRIEIS